MNEELTQRVIEFVSEQVGVDKSEIQLHTTLVGDIGNEGGLALLFMMEFAKEFKVDLSHFDPDKYIGLESGLPMPRFLKKFFVGDRLPPELVPISIRDLIEAAECGEWRN